MDRIESFYRIAEEYCNFISDTKISIDSVPSLIELIMRLYISALNLPEIEPETEDALPSISSEPLQIHFSQQISPDYWEIFNPRTLEEPVYCNLLDDLSDIASDLQKGMVEYQSGRIGNAVFEWRFGLNSHWGNHAVDALRALHAIRMSG